MYPVQKGITQTDQELTEPPAREEHNQTDIPQSKAGNMQKDNAGFVGKAQLVWRHSRETDILLLFTVTSNQHQ
jgi:hypothetical protein